MLVIVSPAKKLDFVSDVVTPDWTIPEFIDQSSELVKEARKLSRDKLSKLMKLSDNLTELNYERFRAFSTPFSPANARPALYAFKGDTYVGLDAESLSEDDVDYAQDHFRILSGLYGLLRPRDLMQPYRLEMGRALANERGKNLYEFWDDRISEALNRAEQDVIINCASNEYFKAVKEKTLNARVITPVFKQIKDGEARMLGMMAKRARGLMARYIIQNRIEDPEELKKFNLDGYKFQPMLSDHRALEFHKIQ